MKPVLAVALSALVLLAGCQEQRATPAPSQAGGDKYARDRERCRGQVIEYMRTRRDIDDSRREVHRGESDRAGMNALPTQMAAYGDNKNFDKLMSSCMEARGWAPAPTSWWQRLGS